MTDDEKSNHTNKFVELYLDEVVRPILPKARIASLFSFGSSEDYYKRATLDLSRLNENYIDSNYYYNGHSDFIHYTSIDNALSIINDSAIRFYDFNNLDDPNEFSFIYKEIANVIDETIINRLKKQLFSFSLCEYSENSHPDSFEMWRLYGRDGNGVAIIFEVENSNKESWANYMLSKMQYGDDEKKRVFALKMASELFEVKYKNDFTVDNFEDIIFTISGLHKNKIYSNENEVRFLYINDELKRNPHHDYHTDSDIYDAFNPKNTRTHYFKLNLFSPTYQDNIEKPGNESLKKYVTEYRPKIKIKEIIIGYRHKTNFLQLAKLFNLTLKRRYGADIPIKLTKIAENF